jgi:aspartate beta-hydroxylase
LCLNALNIPTAKPRPSPTLFFFPGLTSRAWHDPKEYSWIKELENNHAVIKEEYFSLKKVREMQQGVSDYKINDKEHQLHQGAWDWLSYVTQGKRQEEFAIHCPHTTEILERIPSFMTGLPFAYAFFSSLKPQVSQSSSIRWTIL